MNTAERKVVVTLPSDLEIRITRDFNAPRELVFETLTDPKHVANWWGCAHSTMGDCVGDVRVGGKYRYVMLLNGKEYPFAGEYIEIDRPSKLVVSEVFDIPPHNESVSTVTILLDEIEEGTRLTQTTVYSSREARDESLKSGVEIGVRESFEKLDVLLEKLA